MIKKQWKTGKAFTIVEQRYLKALLFANQDLKNNPNLFDNDYQPTSNSATLERGVPNDKLRNSLGGR